MKDLWNTLKLAAYILALPLLATAMVSAHQYLQDDEPVTVVVTPKTEATSALVGLNDTFRQHTIGLNEDGDVNGRVWLVDGQSKTKAGLADSKVYFARDGKVVSQVYTDPDGTFTVGKLTEGAYSFIVSNVEGVAVYGVNIVEKAEATPMEVVVVSKNSKQAEKLLDQKNERSESTELTREVVRGSNVATLISGELEGRLYSTFRNVDFTGSVVKIYDIENNVVGEAEVDAEGLFIVSDLETGYYEFVATGPQGHAAFGFEAVESNESFTSTAAQGVFNAMVTSPVDSYVVGDCGTCGNAVAAAPVQYAASCAPCAGAFSACGGCGGGCGGLGGVGGGFGGIGGGLGGGRLLGILGLAFGIAGIADDDSADPGPVTPSGIL